MTDVTIVVATYDRPVWLEVELHSILASAATVRGRGVTTRVLVVDDASPTDAARDVAARLGVDYLRRTENGGIAATLASGFAQVESPLYAFWGDDDYMLPRWFDLHLAAIAEGADVVSSSYHMADGALYPTQQCTLAPVTFADLRADIVSANDGSLVRREVTEAVGLRPERERAMMLTLWLALAAAGRRFATIAEPTWLYRRHGANMSGQLAISRRDPHFAQLRREAIAEYAVPA